MLRKVSDQNQAADQKFELGYEVEGILVYTIKVGEPVVIQRHRRNHLWRDGIFISSPVLKIEIGKIVTENSVYAIL